MKLPEVAAQSFKCDLILDNTVILFCSADGVRTSDIICSPEIMCKSQNSTYENEKGLSFEEVGCDDPGQDSVFTVCSGTNDSVLDVVPSVQLIDSLSFSDMKTVEVDSDKLNELARVENEEMNNSQTSDDLNNQSSVGASGSRCRKFENFSC